MTIEETVKSFMYDSTKRDVNELARLFSPTAQIIADPWKQNPHGEKEIVAFLQQAFSSLTINYSIPSIKYNQCRIWAEVMGDIFKNITPVTFIFDFDKSGKISCLDIVDMTP